MMNAWSLGWVALSAVLTAGVAGCSSDSESSAEQSGGTAGETATGGSATGGAATSAATGGAATSSSSGGSSASSATGGSATDSATGGSVATGGLAGSEAAGGSAGSSAAPGGSGGADAGGTAGVAAVGGNAGTVGDAGSGGADSGGAAGAAVVGGSAGDAGSGGEIASGGAAGSDATGLLVLEEEASGTTVELTVGQQFQVRLASNPSTGYEWELASEANSVFQQVGEKTYIAGPVEMPGSGGTEVFTFEAAAAGEAQLTLIYHRTWEDVDPVDTFELTVVVGS